MRVSLWQACLAGIGIVLVTTAGAVAVVITFDSVVDGTPLANGGTYTENGMKATSHSNYSQFSDAINMLPTNALYFHGNDSNDAYSPAGIIGVNNAYIEFSMADGSTFDLLSLTLVSGGNYGTQKRRWVTTSAGAEYWPLFQDTAVVVPLTFSGSSYSNLDWFRVGTVWFATELDNIAFNVVPEPGTTALLAMGALGFLGGAARRRRGK